ncbi:MAG: DUF2147 domain-containing protein [Acinetobacter sp.]|nr:DUF2147 domain-containing protein [Acinetobacter sp.]MBP7793412.1 DUF2147 domain-containing protein [Acinetobacter sp.]
MYTKFLKPITILSIVLFSNYSFASTDPLIGKWKTIDERTGYSLSDIQISKMNDDSYEATIVDIRTAPGAPLISTCTQCTGQLKNKPLVGFSTLYDLKASSKNRLEFSNGTYRDPKTGLEYKSHVRLSNNGKHLSLRNTLPNSTIGRNLTWVKY